MDIRGLATVPLFAALDEARLCDIASQAPPRDLPSDTQVARAGEPARHLVVVERGTLRATRDTVAGTRVGLATVTGPALVDKAAVLDGGRHTATWTTATPARIRRLPAYHLTRLVDEVPAVRDHLLRHLAGQVNRDRRRQVRAVAGPPVARVADWLASDHGGRDGRIRLPGAQQGLGEHLGLSRVTVNRALRTLARAGVLRVETAAVVVLDPVRLAAAARQDR
ncbi:Crp/Fnr family transcriptional regulator [Plantactinospora sp. GCM10030261]|uniref:Crp/Fnr family transcriptional regulator n=1 Tax=Plantactinospora sp. GCM10030261 TaxID=3273420 RepID=UPI0036116028